jgi:hypothetical protein
LNFKRTKPIVDNNLDLFQVPIKVVVEEAVAAAVDQWVCLQEEFQN